MHLAGRLGVWVVLATAFAVLGVSACAQKAGKWEVVADLVDALTGPTVENPNGASATTETLQGLTRRAIFQHPNAPGRPLVRLTFRDVELPKIMRGEKLVLDLSVGIREGFSKVANPTADGCEFVVWIDAAEALRVRHDQQRWRDERVDLTPYAGRTVSITFSTAPLQNSSYDWAVWGGPRIVIEGRAAKPRPIPPIPFLSCSVLDAKPVPSRIVDAHQDERTAVVSAVMDRDLDLATALADEAKRAGPAPAPLGPEIVVGEGPDPHNHTLVRILDGHGICRTQFLAFGPGTLGGVSVSAGDLGGGACIVASPLTDATVRQIRLYDRHGGLQRAFEPHPDIAPPYSVAVGRFLASTPGAQIAVASARPQPAAGFAAFYDARGRLLGRMNLPGAAGDTVVLGRADGAGADRLLVTLPHSGRALAFDLRTGAISEWKSPALQSAGAAYVSAFGSETLLVPTPDPLRSTALRIPRAGEPADVDLGACENRFWIQWYDPKWADRPDGRYVRKSVFRHLRTDAASPAARDPRLALDPARCAGADFLKPFSALLDSYDRDLPALWEPCFTHRWMKNVFQPWRDVVDEQTGLPKYVMLSRNNRPIEYGEFGNIDFYSGTYAFGMPELDQLYVQPLRALLRALAPRFRANPEHFVALEPNHEHEIAVEADGTLGDYNPRMIEGFHRYLVALYGVQGLRKQLGVRFARFFDAPRDWGRGEWDRTSKENPFFREWVAYNRYIVDRRVAQTYREALLAGFPAEIVKCHQIPDTYAVGKLSAFSAITSRFTPIDWELNSGAGYGFTRYGVWYKQPHDALQDAHSAGFDAMTLGEYQALTPSVADAVGQLRFIQRNGGMSVHCMMWPAAFDRGFNASMDAAAVSVLQADEPRTVQTGGVGQLRAFRRDGRAFDVVCIGAGPEHPGLLKSVGPTGEWEGSVYATPFHAHVDVRPAALKATRDGAVTCGPFDGLSSGCQIELTLTARSTGRGALRFSVHRGGVELPGLTHTLKVSRGERRCRFALRVQLPVDGLTVVVRPEGAKIRDARATVEAELTPKLSKGVFSGQRHRGAVTFDLLP